MRGPNLTAEALSSGNLAFARFPQRPHPHSCVRISFIVLILTGMSTTFRLTQRSDGLPPTFLRSRGLREKCRRSGPDSRSASMSRRGDRAGRLPVRLAAQAPGSDLVGAGLGQPVAGGRLSAVESVPGRAAVELVHPLLEGELFRTTLGEFRHHLIAFHHGLVALRYGLGQFRFVLGEFLRERGTRRISPGTIVRARSDEFGSPPSRGWGTVRGIWRQ